MPVDKTKNYICEYASCRSSFHRRYDLNRHKLTHEKPEKRPFPCQVEGCLFRANQRGGLKSHVEAIHEMIRQSCGMGDCTITFSDRASVTRHRQKEHGWPTRSGARRDTTPTVEHQPSPDDSVMASSLVLNEKINSKHPAGEANAMAPATTVKPLANYRCQGQLTLAPQSGRLGEGGPHGEASLSPFYLLCAHAASLVESMEGGP